MPILINLAGVSAALETKANLRQDLVLWPGRLTLDNRFNAVTCRCTADAAE